MPKISIITTTYKHENFIKDTIESVLSQTFTDWELLIGDDSPDDLTWEIIQNYVSKYPDKIKAWHHSPNKGIVDNMNFLLEKVSDKSEYIAFLEGDDMFTSDNLKDKMEVFDKYGEVLIVYNNFNFIDKNGNKINKTIGIKLKNGKYKLSLLDFLNLGNPIQSFGVVIVKKELLFKYFPFINLDKNNKMFGPLDYSLWTKIIPNNYFYFLDKPIFIYRKHENNFSKNLEKMYYQFNFIYYEILKENKNEEIIKICNFFIYKNLFIINLFKDNKLKGLSYGIKSFKYNLTKDLIQRLLLIIFVFIPYIKLKNITK